ncbi:CYTH domain-containing protein [Calidifontibacillus oryziterrae]|uniref:CYTH domain-containing protein n=1 Tax=Calidifontibacillus oryziterrae TaxID=1191699 RepID=UPI0002E6F3C3|nr:CYTH domain-containing protein [Calidifontibacillus oryziterrae]
MTQEIEIEYKNLLTKEEFERLIKEFHINQRDFITHYNYYFDTLNFSLKAKGSALRIRKKQGIYTLTLKQPHSAGILETHQQMTENQALSLVAGESLQLFKGEVTNAIKNLGIDLDDIVYLGSLKTDRVELEHEDNLLILDHSSYLGHEDYELEYEVKDAIKGKQRFIQLLGEYDIIIKSTDNKIARFFKLKNNQLPRS